MLFFKLQLPLFQEIHQFTKIRLLSYGKELIFEFFMNKQGYKQDMISALAVFRKDATLC